MRSLSSSTPRTLTIEDSVMESNHRMNVGGESAQMVIAIEKLDL